VFASSTSSTACGAPLPSFQHAPDLGELVHQVALRGQPSGRVGEHDVDPARRCGRDRVERDGRRIAACLRDHRDVVALAPDFELLARRRAERVAGGEQHRMALRLQPLRELADRRRLAGAVHPRDHDHVRPLVADRKRLLGGFRRSTSRVQRARVHIAARAPVARLQVLDQNDVAATPTSAPSSALRASSASSSARGAGRRR
jgi:hypothetical protein